MGGGSGTLTLLPSSVIVRNVVASALTTDALQLGGSGSASFDVSLIGPAQQYREFDQFRKVGDSTWTLTGTTAAVTPWTINQGALSISSDANLGATSGGLTFDGGTLQWGGSFNLSTSRTISLADGGGTFDTSGFNTTITQGITGNGGLIKAGTGTIILAAANNYIGGTTINAGTLQLGNGGTTGSILGNVVNNGIFAIDRSSTFTFGGIISGTGAFEQLGTGTTIFTGANSYTGGTTISAGVLQLGLGGSLAPTGALRWMPAALST